MPVATHDRSAGPVGAGRVAACDRAAGTVKTGVKGPAVPVAAHDRVAGPVGAGRVAARDRAACTVDAASTAAAGG